MIIGRVDGILNGMDVTILLEKAHHLMKIGRYDNAIVHYGRVIEQDS